MASKKTHRFVYRDGDCAWIKIPLVKATDIDCTDMDDDQFIQFLESKGHATMESDNG